MTPAPSPRHSGFALTCRMLAAALLPLLAPAASAQDRGVPGPSYFFSLEEMYRGDYRRAQRGFDNELGRAERTVTTRWIDSACFHAMIGETLYRQGRNAEALAQFDLGCRHFLNNLNVFRQARYPPLQPEANRVRRVAPWAATSRQVTLAQLPPTLLISRGRINNNQQVQQGGVVEFARLSRLNLGEVVRTIALAIRRRNELLGPLSPHDALSRELDDRLSRGGITPAGSWGDAWIDLLAGLAKIGVNKPAEAVNYLRRATLLLNRYDHQLTGVALLALGELAARDPEPAARAAASQLLVEASLAGFLYEDFDVVEHAMMLGHANHVSLGVGGTYPPLDRAIRWADVQNYDPMSLGFRYATAESLLAAGDPLPALALLSTRVRNRDLRVGPLPTRQAFLSAQALFLQGELREASDTLNQALLQQAAFSIRGFQTLQANNRFDAGALSPRIAVQVYGRLLADPTPADWRRAPFDTLTSLRANNTPAYARWLNARLNRREFDKAIEVADLAKRRRYLASLPLGGRAASLHRLLEPPRGAPPLNKDEQAAREAWLLARPGYNQLISGTRGVLAPIEAVGPLLDGERFRNEIGAAYNKLAEADIERQRLLRVMALDRRSAPLNFPPAAPLADVQAKLQEGDAVLMFHQSADGLSGFLIVRDGHHHWRLPSAKKTGAAIAGYLRSLGAARQGGLDLATAAGADDPSADWRTASAELGKTLLADSRLELEATRRLVIIPDGVLWGLPFETLIPPDGGGKPLVDLVPLRVAPTLALAAPNSQPMRPIRRAAVLPSKTAKADREDEQQQAAERLVAAASVEGAPAELLQAPLTAHVAQVAASVDLLVTTLPSGLGPGEPFAWSPVLAGRKGSTLASWTRLGGRAPERLVLGGSQTIADNAGGRRARRGSGAGTQPGNDLFLASCGLLASGVRTALLSRWTTDGLTHNNLLREFTAEAPHVPAPEAWRRSVALARDTRLDPPQEPRLQIKPDDEPPFATHPFFWGGFLLLDTGFDAADALPDEPPEADNP